MHIFDIFNDIPAVLHCPGNLHDTDPLPDGIQHVGQDFIKILNALKLFIHKSRDLLVCIILGKRLHLPVKARHGKLPCLHL